MFDYLCLMSICVSACRRDKYIRIAQYKLKPIHPVSLPAENPYECMDYCCNTTIPKIPERCKSFHFKVTFKII